MHRRRLFAALALAGPLASCSASRGSDDPQPAPPTAAFTQTEITRLNRPWAAAVVPATKVLAITLKAGQLALVDLESRATTSVTRGLPAVLDEGQGGLGDIAFAPESAGLEPSTVYLTWAEAGPNGTAGAVLGRGHLALTGEPAIIDLEIIWRQTPKVSGRNHYSHKMAFSPDGRYLFLSSGERNQGAPAQDLTNNLGKVLRLLPDGSAAPGNPFADRGAVAGEIWSYGHRNVLGLAFDGDGRLWESEMGPRGGDELNLIEAGKNYGWPKASNGSNYDGSDIPDHSEADGYAPPKASWNPSISPGSLMIYRGDRFAGWKDDAFLGALSGQSLVRVTLDGEVATKADEWDFGSRIRDVVEGPDGSIYVVEDGGSARLLRLTPH